MFNPEEINSLIRSRRSVFADQYVPGKKIPDEIIQQLLENANCAPTHKLTEPWRFTIFTGEGLKKFAEFQSELYKKNAGDKFKQDKYGKLATTPLLCSHIIAIGMKRNVSVPEMEEIAAVACAVENMYLSTVAYGIGGYWSTGGVTYDEEAKSFFGLQGDDRLMGFFYLGYIQTPSVKSMRRPINEKITWIRE
ncbi:MAG: nitroreductase [Bacteroidetes bacterium]|nr:nitroreductase [Bacteroidota bacterium]